MDIYSNSKRITESVIRDLSDCAELIGLKDESHERQFGFVPGIGLINESNLLKEQSDKLKEGIFQVLFTGGFSAGKSTLLNALIRKNLLMTSINAETAVITKIVFGANEKVIIHKKSVNSMTGKPITEEMSVQKFFDFYRVSVEEPDKFIDIEYAQINQEQDGLAGSMVQFIDSPGTSNSEEDTKAARDFAKKASAIVYLINATMPFTLEDKEYIAKHYANKELKNLFFVINRFDSVTRNQVPNLKNNVVEQLRAVFTYNGRYDETLFNNRVFYTNAYGSICARTNTMMEDAFGNSIAARDDMTGVPEFESALGKYLTDGNRDKDALAAYIPKMADIYVSSEKKIAGNLAVYNEGIVKIKADSDALNSSIEKINNILTGIESSCRVTAQNIVSKINNSYDSFVNSVDNGWDEYADLTSVSFTVFKFVITRDIEKRKEMMRPINAAIQTYVDSKQKVLSANINDAVESEIAELEKKLKRYQEQLENLDCPINVSDILKTMRLISTPNQSKNVEVNTFQMIIGLVGMDPDLMIKAAGSGMTNSQAVLKSIGKNVFEYIAINVVAWPIGLAMLAKRGWDMYKSIKDGGVSTARDFIKKMRADTINDLRSGKNKLSMEMEKSIGGALLRAGSSFSESFRNELNEKQKAYEEMIRNIENEQFSIDDETERTSNILKMLVKKISHISEVTGGKALSADDIRAMS